MDHSAALLTRAARETFARYGVRRSTMADVAKAAGVVRQTVYNTVSSRDELVELAIVQCCEELKEHLTTAGAGDPDDVDEALLAFLMRAVDTASTHTELNELNAALPADRVKELFGHSHPIEELIRETARPVLERAKSAGRLRGDTTVDEAGRWIQGVLTFALLHDAARGGQLEHVLRTFALPSVLTDVAHD
ncbi:TetR/AcrR family transcriptional regulator [Nocardioides sp. WS12]|uniref:TetR/AcrR family transcriptional regulator n=1 Tax=Nocardioides sp. WS12 TaxID=2486272 RepID=UPI0015F84065|nr:TetR/AcrR family transcriptional regulator [Nocardioides sp. WS12]